MAARENVIATFSIKRVSERCLWAALIFCTVYQSYRYPLQINTASMSPVYSDTPVIFQITKAVILLTICAASAFYLPVRRLPTWKWTVVFVAAYLSFYALFKAVLAKAGSPAYMEVALWPTAALIVVLSTTPITVASLTKYLRFVFYYALLSTAVELFLFFAIGRLPSMAYSTNLLITTRFGGFLDDPNGFGPLLFMLMGWSSVHFSGKRRFLAEVALLLCVFLTQSLTAIAFLPVLALFLVVRHVLFRSKPTVLLGVALGLVVLFGTLGATWKPIYEFASSIIEMRSGSVNSHIEQVTNAHNTSLVDVLFGGPAYLGYESWWTSSFLNFGAVWYLLNVGLALILLFGTFRAARRAKSVSRRAVMSAFSMYSAYFVFGSLNLPFYSIFPASFLFFFISYLTFFDKIREEEQVPEHRDEYASCQFLLP